MVRAPRPVPSPPEPVECLLRGPLPCPRPPRLAPGAGEGLPSVGELLFQPLHRGFQLVLGRRGGVGRPAGLGRCLLGLGNRRPVPAFPLRPQLVRRRCCWRPGARVRGCLSPRRPGPTPPPPPPPPLFARPPPTPPALPAALAPLPPPFTTVRVGRPTGPKPSACTARTRAPAARVSANCGSARAAPRVAVTSSLMAAGGAETPTTVKARRTRDSISPRRCCESSLMAEPSSESCAARNSSPSSASSAVTPGSARTSLLTIQADRVGLRSAAICLAAGACPASRPRATRAPAPPPNGEAASAALLPPDPSHSVIAAAHSRGASNCGT